MWTIEETKPLACEREQKAKDMRKGEKEKSIEMRKEKGKELINSS